MTTNARIGNFMLANPHDQSFIFSTLKKAKKRVAIIGAFVWGGDVIISYSKLRKGDKFSTQEGLGAARLRAENILKGSEYNIPFIVQENIDEMVVRASKYFKIPPKYIVLPKQRVIPDPSFALEA